MKAIIIDDEESGRKTLSWLLETYCSEVEIMGMASDVKSAVAIIQSQKPDLIFLDIDLGTGTGFEILEQIQEKSFSVIFVTAYSDYAIKAFEFSALHYLLKPVNPQALQDAVNRAETVSAKPFPTESFNHLVRQLKEHPVPKRLFIPNQTGIDFLEIKEIMRCEGEGNYATFYLKDGSKKVASKGLSEYEPLLADSGFFRIHRAHLVNLAFIKRYIRGRGGSVEMEDGTEIDVSRYKKEALLKMLKLS